jgi:RNA recognition motif-containing protein
MNAMHPPQPQLHPPQPAPTAPTAASQCKVYVGKISPLVDEVWIKKLLQACGALSKWTRLTDMDTKKLKSFGFAEFLTALGAARAVRLLHETDTFPGQKLMLKPDQQTQEKIVELRFNEYDTQETEVKNQVRQVVAEWTASHATEIAAAAEAEKLEVERLAAEKLEAEKKEAELKEEAKKQEDNKQEENNQETEGDVCSFAFVDNKQVVISSTTQG